MKLPRCLWAEENQYIYLLAVYTALVSTDGDELLTADREAISESLVARSVGGDQGVNLLLGELYFDKLTLATVSTSVTPPRTSKNNRRAYREAGRGSLNTGEVSGENTSLVELARAHQAVRKKLVSICIGWACMVGCFDFEGNNEGHIRGRGTVMGCTWSRHSLIQREISC
jgi:hypothetical protein